MMRKETPWKKMVVIEMAREVTGRKHTVVIRMKKEVEVSRKWRLEW